MSYDDDYFEQPWQYPEFEGVPKDYEIEVETLYSREEREALIVRLLRSDYSTARSLDPLYLLRIAEDGFLEHHLGLRSRQVERPVAPQQDHAVSQSHYAPEINIKKERRKPGPKKSSRYKKPVKIGEDRFIEEDGHLVRVESWLPVFHSDAGYISEEEKKIKEFKIRVGKQVLYQGRLISSSILLHFLRTGEWVKRVPKERGGPQNPFRAVVWDGERMIHLGCFPTQEERDAAVLGWKLKHGRPFRVRTRVTTDK